MERGLRGLSFRATAGAAAPLAWLGIGALLAGCAPLALERATPGAPAAVLTAFEVAGRMSVRHRDAVVAAGFRWQHADLHDQLELVSPLGQTVALLSGDPSAVRLQGADGKVSMASDWGALTEQELGWPLPVRGLASWIQGAPRPGETFSVETDGDGRAAVLRQDGWTIVYQSYAQASDAAWRPSRLILTYPEVEVRIAIDQWQ